MAAILDVWVARPGDACHVDDHHWTVHVFDSHGVPYKWATNDYSNLPAPQAHWAGAIPPGCYLVTATGTNEHGEPVSTDHAIANVGCDGIVCVHLYVAGQHHDEPHRCTIEIKDVEATGDAVVTSVEVSGTATDCNEVEVTFACREGEVQAITATVTSAGTWKVTFDEVRRLECKCGGPVHITARCTTNRRCTTTWNHTIECRDPKRPTPT